MKDKIIDAAIIAMLLLIGLYCVLQFTKPIANAIIQTAKK